MNIGKQSTRYQYINCQWNGNQQERSGIPVRYQRLVSDPLIPPEDDNVIYLKGFNIMHFEVNYDI